MRWSPFSLPEVPTMFHEVPSLFSGAVLIVFSLCRLLPALVTRPCDMELPFTFTRATHQWQIAASTIQMAIS